MNYTDLLREKYPDIIKVRDPLNKKQSLFSNILCWNKKYWEKVMPEQFEANCIKKLEENDVFKEYEQRCVIKQFLAQVTVEDTDINADYLFCTRNGVIDIWEILKLKDENEGCDLATCMEEWILPHEKYKENFLTMYSDVEYIARSKRDLSFFENLLKKDFLKADTVFDWFFNHMAGFLIHGNPFQQFLEFFGKKRTGKTTIVNFLMEIMGGYVCSLPEGIFIDRQSYFMTELYRKRKYRLMIYSEPDNKPIKASLLKRITGNSTIDAKGNVFTMKAKIIIDSNYLLRTKNGNDDAFNERRVIIPFGNYIPEEKRDLKLNVQLGKYKNDVFSEMVDRLHVYANTKVSKPVVSREIEEKEKCLLDPIRAFYEDCCQKTNATTSADATELYQFYNRYFHPHFNEMLKIDGVSLFEDDAIKESLKMSQTHFNSEITFIHKDVVRPGNCLKLRGLILKSEKEHWGNQLDFIRNDETKEKMENVKGMLNNAKSMTKTVNKPIEHIQKLWVEICKDFLGEKYTKDEWDKLISLIIAHMILNSNPQTEKTGGIVIIPPQSADDD
jgi:phage/plasmid-associated DNA primase